MDDAATARAPSPPAAAGARVAICVPTWRRPQRLFELLGALDALELGDAPPEIRVVVVDNDAEESARDACEQARRFLRHELRYAVEKRKGIPPARNACVAAALGFAEWIAFIDDDELPDPRWLERLLALQRETGAAVVTGPVLPRFAEEPPAWVVEGAFFVPPRFETGSLRPHAFTNNVLVSAAALTGQDRLFDERFSFGVGEDDELFERIALAGHAIVWADDAIVHEVIPPERATARWLLARGFRTGTACTHNGRLRGRSDLYVVCHAGWCLAKGLVLAVAGGSRHRSVWGLRLAAFGIGRLAGLVGIV